MTISQSPHISRAPGDKKPVAEVARLLKVHRATLYRALDTVPAK